MTTKPIKEVRPDVQAFERAEVGHGPWFSDDSEHDVWLDIRAHCPEEAESIRRVVGDTAAVLAFIRAQLNKRAKG